MLHIGWSFGVCGNNVVLLYAGKMAAQCEDDVAITVHSINEQQTNIVTDDNKKTITGFTKSCGNKKGCADTYDCETDTSVDESTVTTRFTNTTTTRLRPLACLEPGCSIRLALIILNQPLLHQYPHLVQLWNRAVVRTATDGASNHLCDVMNIKDNTHFIPDLLTGDFDSARPEVLLYMKDKGAKLIETKDQNFTDFTKCLKILTRTIDHNNLKPDCLVTLGAFGGRFDHTLSIINTLFDMITDLPYPIYLIGDDNLGCLLMPGNHVIEMDTGLEDNWCALIPIGGKCNNVKTTGLKYNLENQSMQFGGLISTSNQIEVGAKEVTVETDSPLFWAMGIKKLKLKETN